VNGWEEAARDRVLAGARLRPGDDVLDLSDGGGALAFGARELIGDGWVYAVAGDPARLEELQAAAHERDASGIALLLGGPEALPLPDASVDAVVGRRALGAGADLVGRANELHRVLRSGGRLSLHEAEAGDALADALRGAGFTEVAVDPDPEAGGEALVTARKP
jgi:ubiquinone/menaquinone biosynthesis C-methylase UbiE